MTSRSIGYRNDKFFVIGRWRHGNGTNLGQPPSAVVPVLPMNALRMWLFKGGTDSLMDIYHAVANIFYLSVQALRYG